MVQEKGSGRSIVRKMLAFESNPCENSKQWLKKLDDLGF
jgi:hypothetical protein